MSCHHTTITLYSGVSRISTTSPVLASSSPNQEESRGTTAFHTNTTRVVWLSRLDRIGSNRVAMIERSRHHTPTGAMRHAGVLAYEAQAWCVVHTGRRVRCSGWAALHSISSSAYANGTIAGPRQQAAAHITPTPVVSSSNRNSTSLLREARLEAYCGDAVARRVVLLSTGDAIGPLAAHCCWCGFYYIIKQTSRATNLLEARLHK